jgi:AraC-like DNA-binding protein
MSLFVKNGGLAYAAGMDFAIHLDQPDLARRASSRRFVFGAPAAPAVVILNGAGSGFEGGADCPDLSLKWVPEGLAEYSTEGRAYRMAGASQLLLNRGQSYRMYMKGPSESFALFFPEAAAEAAWQAHTGTAETMPEVPTAAAPSHPALRSHLVALRVESRSNEPSGERLRELSCAVLAEIVALAATRRGQAMRIPAARRSTREELLRRLLRAETYLVDTGAAATLTGAADAAALSPFHLIRLFNGAFGETPLAYGARLRLERAREDLVCTRKPIVDVAEDAGYASRTAFDRAFRRRFQTTPGAVRASAA